ncbi:MAG: CotH kinase family protein [Treponema sp.]|nr:CotH kinase family protein [Treponema sp.]
MKNVMRMGRSLGLFFVFCIFGLFGITSCEQEVTPSPSSSVNFPRIKITSTENNGNMNFVLEPIAKVVTDSYREWYEAGWGEYPKKDAPNPWYEKCEIKDGDGNLIGTGQVKVRGNWTTDYDKKSLRIKFDKKQSMYGLNGNAKFKNWVLLAVYKDASFLRDAVGLEMYRKLFSGYASDCKLVEVEVNGTYMGVYLLAEQQEAKRLGLTEPEKNATNTDIGYLIEFDHYYNSEAVNEKFEIDYLGTIRDYAGNQLVNPVSGYTIKSDITNVAQHDFISDYMNNVWKICYEAVNNKRYYKFNSSYELVEWTDITGANDNEKCKNCVKEVIDIDSLADTYVFNELVCDPDLPVTSFFMSVDFSENNRRKLTFSAPWDFDSTMGNKSFCIADISNEISSKTNMRTINEMFAGLCQTNTQCTGAREKANPWMVIFVRQAWFQDMVKTSWAGVKSKNVLPELTRFIDENSNSVYQASFNADREKWGNPSGNDELCNASKIAASESQSASAAYLKEWLAGRFSAVDTIITGMTTN